MLKVIYCLRDPDTRAVRYIGATKQTLAKRLSVHLALCHRTTTSCARWLRGLLAGGKRPVIERIEGPVDDWQEAERRWIAQYRPIADLLNQTDGGMGCHGCRPADASRAKRSASLKQRYADPVAMAERQELARRAGRSTAGRAAASARMRSIWSDPELSSAMRERMRGAKQRKRDASCS
jgi:hypothetical protein